MTANLPKSLTDKIVKSEACWEWTGTHAHGYGLWWDPDRKSMRVAHRALYEKLYGEVPKTLDLDHLCRNRGCLNPEHLEPVSRSENIRRGAGPDIIRARQGAKTHCKRGHAYSGDNLYVNPRGQRECRECRKISKRNSYAKSKVN